VVRLTQLFEQLVKGAAHAAVHVPDKQTCVLAHTVPHSPQFFGSDAVLTHCPPQRENPALHDTPHLPSEQIGTPLATPGQLLPHDPQLRTSVATLTQAAPHFVNPALHDKSHALAAQVGVPFGVPGQA
jgi:hypothetical protein